jgi:hypothetical protein
VSGGPSLLALVPYLVLRSRTGAYLPTTAPPYYRFTFDPAQLARNVAEYADRTATFTVVALLLLLLLIRRTRRLEPQERRWVFCGATWLAGGFALSLFVPARSSLYVCLPSVGVALVGAALARGLWSQVTPRVQSRLIVTAILVPLALVPLLHSRNQRSRRAADLSAAVLTQMNGLRSEAPPGSTLVLEDDPGQRPSLREAFGTLLEPALALQWGSGASVEYLPSGDDWTEARLRLPGAPTPGERRFRLQQGQLVPVD